MNRSLVAAAVLALGVLAPASARAFCRTTTVPVAADFQPDPKHCWEEGKKLFWRNSCTSYNLQQNASKQVSLDDAKKGMAAAFTKWTGSSCPTDGTGRSRVSIDVRDLGPVACGEVDYNQTGPNQNVIVFRDDNWPHHDSNNTLALTTVTFNPDTGEIYDADMEINTHDQPVSLDEVAAPDAYDFLSIVTHETGHFLGLAHSGDNRATMYANYTPGATAMRNLTSDDVDGICTVYRPDGTHTVDVNGETQVASVVSCDPTPRRGFTTACADATKKSCLGSSMVASKEPVGPWWIAALGAVGVAIAGRRVSRMRGIRRG